MDATLHLDYLSISTPHPAWGIAYEDHESFHESIPTIVPRIFTAYPSFVHHTMGGSQELFGGGNGYKHRRFYGTGGWSLFYGASHNRVLLQMPGEACHLLRMDTDSEGEKIGLNPLLSHPANRMTRIDIAATFRDGVEPLWLASRFLKKDIADMSQINSDTGRTVYIGAPTSEVHCRVYRYAPPHPRSDWIRIEFVLKGNHAQRAQERIPDIGLEPIMKGLLEKWGFSADEYVNSIRLGAESEKIAYEKRQKAGSLRWLYKTAIPSLKSALDSGIIPPADVYSLLGLKSPDDPL